MFNLAKDFSLRIGKIALIVTVAVLALFVVLAFLRFGFIYWIYSTVEDWVTVRLGFDYYLAQLIATAFSAIFSLLLPSLIWYIFLGKKKAWGIGTIIGVQALICASIYTLGSGVCFDRQTGKPLCYYVDSPQGRVWSYTPGFDPHTGKKFKLYTREIKEMEEKRSSGIPKDNSKNQIKALPIYSPGSAYSTKMKNEQLQRSKKFESTRTKITLSRRNSDNNASPENTALPQKENNFQYDQQVELEETRRQQILTEQKVDIEEHRRKEDENYRRKREEEKLERDRQAEQSRIARQEKIENDRREHEQMRRQSEKERRKMETVKVIIETAKPVIRKVFKKY